MTWEYKLYSKSINLISYDNAIEFLTKQTLDGPNDKTAFAEILELGKEGWEMVSVCPISNSEGETTELLFAFKRQLK